MPERVQLRRTKGWRMPAGTVKVDRSTKWGNPFVPDKTFMGVAVRDRRHAFVLYRAWAPLNADLVAAARLDLRGKNLGCWCPKEDPYEDGCHAAVLICIANGED